MEGFEDQGLHWTGSREELEQWKVYKKQKALAFVELGYSVAWYPDGDNWMGVYTPERRHARTPELKATAKFFRETSRYGIDSGRISKLTIQLRSEDLIAKVAGAPFEEVETLFNYDRGLDIDRLDENPRARELYDHVLRELG